MSFLEEMQWWEIRRFLAGMRRRERSGWNQTRMLAWMVLSALGSKAEKPSDLLPFWWEEVKEEVDEEEEKRKVEELRRWAEEYNRVNGR